MALHIAPHAFGLLVAALGHHGAIERADRGAGDRGDMGIESGVAQRVPDADLVGALAATAGECDAKLVEIHEWGIRENVLEADRQARRKMRQRRGNDGHQPGERVRQKNA